MANNKTRKKNIKEKEKQNNNNTNNNNSHYDDNCSFIQGKEIWRSEPGEANLLTDVEERSEASAGTMTNNVWHAGEGMAVREGVEEVCVRSGSSAKLDGNVHSGGAGHQSHREGEREKDRESTHTHKQRDRKGRRE